MGLTPQLAKFKRDVSQGCILSFGLSSNSEVCSTPSFLFADFEPKFGSPGPDRL